MKNKIIYYRKEDGQTNGAEVLAFIGSQPKCAISGGDGKKESQGIVNCKFCNSRQIRFVNGNGICQFADWGDTIIKNADGKLFLIVGDDYEK